MTHRTRLAAVAPRLLMLAAVFFCVFGFAVHDAAESAVAGHAHTAVAGPSSEAGHADHSDAVPTALAADPVHPLDGHDGHTGDGDHAINCMPSAATSPAVMAPAADLAVAPVVADVAAPRFAAFSTPAVLPRPPDLSSLCVQRV
ncbi:MAG: hypothetical protein ACT4QF_01640 [Sporichthyaceae bacterium]